MEWLNFHHLRYFWTVARKGGVRKAADELHVSQPSISAQLRLLEDSLGEKLFKRSGRNLVLTANGPVGAHVRRRNLFRRTRVDERRKATARHSRAAIKCRNDRRAFKFIGVTIRKPPFERSQPFHVG